MKVRLSLIFVILSVFFLSCGNSISQEGEGIITLDAGKVARYLGQNASISKSVQARSGLHFMGAEFPDIKSYMNYEMNIKVSTIGQYETSADANYNKPINEIFATNNIAETLESFYKEATGNPIILEDIPVGSKIKVKIELSFGQTFDEDTYKQTLSADLQNLMNEELDNIKSELANEYKTVEATSETFTVQKGENKITIKLDTPEDLGLDQSGFDIVLYTKITDSINGNGLWLYKSKNTNVKLFNKNKYLGDAFSDFTTSVDGTIFYNIGNSTNNRHLYKFNPKTNSQETEIVLNDLGYIEKMYVDEEENVLFYGCIDENYYFIDSYPLILSSEIITRKVRKPGSDSNYEFCIYGDSPIDPENSIRGFSTIFDFTVELGEKSQTENEGLKTIAFDNSSVYLAAYWEDGDSMSGYSYDLCFIKIPMSYTIQQITENEIETTMLMDDTNLSFLYLSEIDPMFESYKHSGNYGQYPFEITDMVVRNGKLFALLNAKLVGPYQDYWPDGNQFNPDAYNPFIYPVNSYGMILKIDLSTFASDNVQMLGYNSENRIEYEIAQISDEEETGNMITFQVKQPVSEKAPFLFAPRKFIAIKPDELVIADDGSFYYKNDNDFCYKNEDRVVVFNTSTNELTAYQLNMASEVKFENNETSEQNLIISGCFSDVPAAPCKYRP